MRGVENNISISKPLTAIALLQLWQRGKVDLDAPIQEYVPEFPVKEYDGEKVEITTRQLLSHTATCDSSHDNSPSYLHH